MKNVIRTTTSGFKNKVRGGGVLSKTLLTTAIFAALASTSVSAQNVWYFDYGASSDITGGKATTTPVPGLLIDSTTLGAGNGLSSGASWQFKNDTSFNPSGSNIQVALSGESFSLVVINSDIEAQTNAGTNVISLSTLAGTQPKNVPLTTLTGLYISSAGSLDLANVSNVTNGLAITLSTATSGNLEELAGVNLVGMNALGDYTGKVIDSITVTSAGANALGLNIGGTFTSGTQLTVSAESQGAKATSYQSAGVMMSSGSVLTDIEGTTVTKLTGKVDLSNLDGTVKSATSLTAGLYMTGGEVSLSNASTSGNVVNMIGSITSGSAITGAANAYGAYLTGGKFEFEAANAGASIGFAGSVVPTSGLVSGTANAAGLYVSGATVVVNAATSTTASATTAGSEANAIIATVGGTSGATGNATAYGIYASGAGTSVEIDSAANANAMTITGTITGTASLETAGVVQKAAGIWATDGAVVTVNGNSTTDNKTTISGVNQNKFVEGKTGEISVYGAYASSATLNLTGQIELSVTPDGSATNAVGISATKTTTNITGYTTDEEGTLVPLTANGTLVTVNNGAEFNGGTLNILAGTQVTTTAATMAIGNNANFTADGIEINITGGASDAAAGGAATLQTTGTTGIFDVTGSQINVTAGASKGSNAGGSATLTVTGNATLDGNSILILNSAGNILKEAKAGDSGTAQASFAAGLTLGTAGQSDETTVTVGTNSKLTLGTADGANSVANEGTQIIVETGANLTLGGASGAQTLTIEDGATLSLAQGATVTATTNQTTTVYGTLAITGTTKEKSYAGGLGKVNIEGEVTPNDGSLYLQLNAATDGNQADVLTFNPDSSMNAAYVGVGTNTNTSAAFTSAAQLNVAGGDVTIGELVIGATGGTNNGYGNVTVSDGNLTVTENLTITAGAASKANTVTVNGGYLTLGSPTIDGTEVESVLDIGASNATLTVGKGGTLVTDSRNLWSEDPSKTTTSLTPTFGPASGLVTQAGSFIELTNPKVDTGWLTQAKATQSNAGWIIDGQLLNNGKTVTSVLPMFVNGAPDNSMFVNTGVLQNVLVLDIPLNATTQPFTFQGTTTTYGNLVIGAATQKSWTQPKDVSLWTITGVAGDKPEVGFSDINIGKDGFILVTNGYTLSLAGNGTNFVQGSNVNLFVDNGTLTLGRTAKSSMAGGGSLDGNVTVTNGGIVNVNYTGFEIVGALTLGAAKTQTSVANPGTLNIAKGGSLTVGSISGLNVGSGQNAGISITGKSSLTVKGSMTVALVEDTTPNNDGEFVIENSKLTVTNDLEVSSAGTQSVVMVATDSVVTVANMSTSNTSVGLDGSTMTINGSLNQLPSDVKTPPEIALAVVSQSNLNVSTDLVTEAQTVWVNNSTVSVGNKLSIGQEDEGTTQAPTTNLVLDGATINANNITFNNIESKLVSDVFENSDGELDSYLNYYQSGDITATSMNLAGSNIMLNSGSLTVNGTLSVNAASTLGLGGISAETLAAIPEASQPTTLVTNASIGTLNLEGGLAINGLAPAAGGQTQVAIGTLNLISNATEETGGDLIVGGKAALMLGNSKVADLPAWVETLNTNKPATMTAAITNYLVAGQSVDVGDYSTVTIGDTIGGAKPTAVLTIGDGVAVAVDGKLLASATSNKQVSLFKYNGAANADNLPTAVISQTAYFLVTNPLGDVDIKVADGFDTEGVELLDSQVANTNPLYEANWLQPNVDPNAPANNGRIAGDEEDAEEPVASTTIAVRINETSVHNILNSLGDNSVIDAAQNLGYGNGYIGADTLLGIIAGVTDDPATVIEARNAINTIALRGAAAHAHEIGISAASMVVDSVWDHGSKLAAAPHEEAKGDLWITLDWNHSRANDYKAGGLDNGYKLDLYGATFGADYDFANGLAAGLAVSVGGGEAKSKGFNAGQKTDVTYWGINLYGTYASPIVNVIGNVGYIGIKNKTKVGGDKGRPDANIWTIGVKAEKDFAINEQFTVTPHVGIRYLSVDVDDFNLQGFHYGTDKANLVQFPIGVAFAANLKTANGASVKPFLDLSFVPTAGDKKVDNTFGIQGGTMSDTIDTTIASTAMFQGKIGVNASYGAHNFGLNFAIGGGNKGRLDTGLQAKYRFVF